MLPPLPTENQEIFLISNRKSFFDATTNHKNTSVFRSNEMHVFNFVTTGFNVMVYRIRSDWKSENEFRTIFH